MCTLELEEERHHRIRFVGVVAINTARAIRIDHEISGTLQKLLALVRMFQRLDLIEAGKSNGRCLLAAWTYQLLEALTCRFIQYLYPYNTPL